MPIDLEKIILYDTEVGDEQGRIEKRIFGDFHEKTGNLYKKGLLRDMMRRFQRNFLLVVGLGSPFIKFIVACAILSSIIAEDTLRHDLMHHSQHGALQKGEVLFLYSIMAVPISAISIFFGLMIFSDYPRVMPTAIDEYLMFRGVVVVLELTSWILSTTQFSLSIKEHITVQFVTMVEVYSILLLKVCSRRRYNLDPLEEPTTMEMTTIKTNLTKELKPVPTIAPGDIENA